MKVKLPLGLVLMVAAMLGYLLGTEAGRRRRDSLVRMIRRQEATDELIEALDESVTEEAASTGD